MSARRRERRNMLARKRLRAAAPTRNTLRAIGIDTARAVRYARKRDRLFF
jgi:hypothetical protein